MVVFLSLWTWNTATAQEERESKVYHFNGSLSATNNGFSFIPTFSLGKPATILDVSLGGDRFSFDPQFRFDLDGLKPWSFIFIWRYKLLNSDKFMLRLGTHLPAIAFSPTTIVENGVTKEKITTKRYFTPELTTTFKVNDRISLGTYYIWGLGLEKIDQTKHTHFIAFNLRVNTPLGGSLFVKWSPQTYYIDLDGTGGFYAAHTLAFGHKEIPIVLATTMNKKLVSDLKTRDFDWNISLAYTFKNEFEKK